jgi:hypothetical protein
MAIGLEKNSSLFAVTEEVTENVAETPAVGEDFIQLLEAVTIEPAKEVVEREVLTPNKGQIQPRATTRSVGGSIPTEWRASGTEGDAPETDILYRSLLGGRRQITSRITTGTGHTTSQLNIVGHSLVVGDFILILEAGAHHLAFIKSVVDVDNVEFVPSMDVAPSDGVEIAETTTYFADTNEPTFTFNAYWANQINEAAIGCRASALALENITTGAVPSATFSYEGSDFSEAVSAAPVSPVFNPSLPPIMLNAMVVYKDVCYDMNELSLSIENTISFLTSVKSEGGRIGSRISDRSVSGTLTPYLDDTDLGFFTDFNANDSFDLVVTVANPSGVDGEFELGSAVGFYCQNCTITTLGKADLDGILTRSLEFSANTGPTGDLVEVFIGMS